MVEFLIPEIVVMEQHSEDYIVLELADRMLNMFEASQRHYLGLGTKKVTVNNGISPVGNEKAPMSNLRRLEGPIQ